MIGGHKRTVAIVKAHFIVSISRQQREPANALQIGLSPDHPFVTRCVAVRIKRLPEHCLEGVPHSCLTVNEPALNSTTSCLGVEWPTGNSGVGHIVIEKT